ncbi:hypothetical protein L0916_004754 [Escherichia coli]|nr:hypothetical protein [Escherichia coli]
MNSEKKNSPFYSKYNIENFEDDIKNTKIMFFVPENHDENNLYLDLIEIEE